MHIYYKIKQVHFQAFTEELWKYMFAQGLNIHNGCIQTSPTLETSQMAINWWTGKPCWMGKQPLWQNHTMKCYVSNKKKSITVAHNNMDDSQKHYAKRKTQHTKD